MLLFQHFLPLCCWLEAADLTRPPAAWAPAPQTSSARLNLAHEYFNTSLLIAQWAVFPTPLEDTCTLMQEVEPTHTQEHVKLYVLLLWAQVHVPTHTLTKVISHRQTVIWWLWMLMSCCGVYPTRMAGVAGGQPPPAFNDVYLARVWGVEGIGVCVTDRQMFKKRERRHQADVSPQMTETCHDTASRRSKEHDWGLASLRL